MGVVTDREECAAMRCVRSRARQDVHTGPSLRQRTAAVRSRHGDDSPVRHVSKSLVFRRAMIHRCRRALSPLLHHRPSRYTLTAAKAGLGLSSARVSILSAWGRRSRLMLKLLIARGHGKADCHGRCARGRNHDLSHRERINREQLFPDPCLSTTTTSTCAQSASQAFGPRSRDPGTVQRNRRSDGVVSTSDISGNSARRPWRRVDPASFSCWPNNYKAEHGRTSGGSSTALSL